MSERFPLTAAFLEGGGPAQKDLASQEELLTRAYADARKRYPKVQVAAEAFAHHLGRFWTKGASTRPTELFIALGCAKGDRAALQTLATEFLGDLAMALKKLETPRIDVDDVKQALLKKLLVSEGRAEPQIAGYSGSGPLKSWLKAAAVRLALNLNRPGRKEDASDDLSMLDRGALSEAPELRMIKAAHRAQLSQAFTDALSQLEAADRTMLRLHYLGGMSLEALATTYQVHRATAARRLAAARDQVLEETTRLLSERLRLNRPEVQSLMKVLRSNLEISFHRVLSSN
ncbi:MAG: sigma-70 family RNA polymerase sigma factor [Myxococcaceae bacterium]